jgi:hypothetical protein
MGCFFSFVVQGYMRLKVPLVSWVLFSSCRGWARPKSEIHGLEEQGYRLCLEGGIAR